MTKEKFSITAKTHTVNGNTDDTFLNQRIKYHIPIYQRPYSWGENQINKFITGIITSYIDTNKNVLFDSLFFGNMQFSEKKSYEKNALFDILLT